MATLTIQAPNNSLALTAASSGGDVFANNGRTMLIVENTSGASRTITATVVRTSADVPGFGTAVFGNTVLALAINGIGTMELPTARFNDATGKVAISANTIAGVKYAVVRMAGS